MFKSSLVAAVLAFSALAFSAHPQDTGPLRPLSEAEVKLVKTLAEEDITLDPARGFCAIPADVTVRDDLLEYLLVGPAGAAHESAFMTPVNPSVLNVALLALGVTPGSNAEWRAKEPQPTEAELRAGASPYDVTLPQGSGFYLYVGWREGDETYVFRVEDLIRNLASGASMKRHEWVYLGSRVVPNGRKGEAAAEVFGADVYQNLVNIAFFREGLTLVTGSITDCVEQGIWMMNSWLVPERGTRVTLFFSRTRLNASDPEVLKLLPLVDTERPAAEGK
jgi:hypothetical protein